MQKESKTKEKRRYGRPPQKPEVVRSKRIATFVTVDELAKLRKISEQEQRSISAVVYKMIQRSL